VQERSLPPSMQVQLGMLHASCTPWPGATEAASDPPLSLYYLTDSRSWFRLLLTRVVHQGKMRSISARLVHIGGPVHAVMNKLVNNNDSHLRPPFAESKIPRCCEFCDDASAWP